MNKNFTNGQHAFESGLSFFDNPFFCTDENHYDWSKGWLERARFYEEKDRRILHQEDELINQKIQMEAEREEQKMIQEKYEKTKKGRMESLGQTTIF